jgi:hypothetical protein
MFEKMNYGTYKLHFIAVLKGLKFKHFVINVERSFFKQELKKYVQNAKSEKCNNSQLTKEVLDILQKIGQDHDFTQQIKTKHMRIWNKKFPLYKIPEPSTVGKLIPNNSEDNS